MANTPKAREGACKALAVHVEHVGGRENSRETQIVDLIADLLLTLPDNHTSALVVNAALGHAVEDRSGV